MLASNPSTHDAHVHLSPVAIHDKELRKAGSFRIEIFELCSLCGARFGIGYFGASGEESKSSAEVESLPGKLIEILATDHRHQRQHKERIDLDF